MILGFTRGIWFAARASYAAAVLGIVGVVLWRGITESPSTVFFLVTSVGIGCLSLTLILLGAVLVSPEPSESRRAVRYLVYGGSVVVMMGCMVSAFAWLAAGCPVLAGVCPPTARELWSR